MQCYLISTSLVCLMLFVTMVSFAHDGDFSGVSDVYEDEHGQTLPAAEDADLDGYSNYLESLFGSDPLDPADPGNFNFSVFGNSASMSVPNQVGFRYRVESSLTLAVDSWQSNGDFQVSDGMAGVAEF